MKLKATAIALALSATINVPAWAGKCNNSSLVGHINSNGLAERQWDGHLHIGRSKSNCRKSQVRGLFVVPRFSIRCRYQGRLITIGNPNGSRSWAGYFSTSREDSYGRCSLERQSNWYVMGNAYKMSGYWDRNKKRLTIYLSNGMTLRLYQV